MSKPKIKLTGVRELLKSTELQAYLEELGNGMASRAGDGYETKTNTFPERCTVSVYATTRKAKKDNIENNTLLKAMGGKG